MLRLSGALLTGALSVSAAHAAPEDPGEAHVLLRTDVGDIVLALYPEAAPTHAQRITELVELGVYDSTEFFHVDPAFVAQLSHAGTTRALTPAQAAAVKPIPLETSTLKHTFGRLTMARELDVADSATTSFSILLADAPHLDGDYTVFGHVARGMDVVEQITRIPRDANNRPLQPVRVIDADVIPTAAEAHALPLTPPREVVFVERPGAPASLVFAGFATVAGLFLAVAIGTARGAAPRTLRFLALSGILVAAFVGAAVYLPDAPNTPLVSLALLLALVAMMKGMNFIDRPDPEPPSP